jgi:formiminotetrahydrofolate cyclodeaminase
MDADNRPFRELSLAEFMDHLASEKPVPGGGSASAVAGSLAASLVAMVAQLSRRGPLAQHAAVHELAESSGRRLAARLLEIAEEDAVAYGTFAAALKLPRATQEESDARAAAKKSAAWVATEVPIRCLEACLEVEKTAELLAGRCNLNASSDLTVASLLAEAAAKGAAANVRVNLPSVGDQRWADETDRRVTDLLEELTEIANSCRTIVAAGRMREPAGLVAAP